MLNVGLLQATLPPDPLRGGEWPSLHLLDASYARGDAGRAEN